MKPLIVHPFDIRYRTDAAVVFVVGVTAAVVLIGINDGQNLDKMLPRVVLIINQFVIISIHALREEGDAAPSRV